jgi:hypothetical protein
MPLPLKDSLDQRSSDWREASSSGDSGRTCSGFRVQGSGFRV